MQVPRELLGDINQALSQFEITSERLEITWAEEPGFYMGFTVWPHGANCQCGHYVRVLRYWIVNGGGMFCPEAQMSWSPSGPGSGVAHFWLSKEGSAEFVEAMHVALLLASVVEAHEPTSLGSVPDQDEGSR